MSLWETLLGWVNKDVKIIVREDNAAMIQVMNTGNTPTMRGLGNTHCVSINRLNEAFGEPWNKLIKEDTTPMVGDISTKAFENKEKWTHACRMINLYDVDDLDTAPRIAGGKDTQRRHNAMNGSKKAQATVPQHDSEEIQSVAPTTDNI